MMPAIKTGARKIKQYCRIQTVLAYTSPALMIRDAYPAVSTDNIALEPCFWLHSRKVDGLTCNSNSHNQPHPSLVLEGLKQRYQESQAKEGAGECGCPLGWLVLVSSVCHCCVVEYGSVIEKAAKRRRLEQFQVLTVLVL